MRKVMKAEEVIHAWVHQTQDEARTPTHNLSFDCAGVSPLDVIRLYSYSTVIATRFKQPEQEDIIFVTENNYSVTTGKQLSELRYALRGGFNAQVMHVPDSIPDTWRFTAGIERVWKEQIQAAASLVKKSIKARSNKPIYLAQAERYLTDANYLQKRFGLIVPPAELATLDNTLPAYEATKKLISLR